MHSEELTGRIKAWLAGPRAANPTGVPWLPDARAGARLPSPRRTGKSAIAYFLRLLPVVAITAIRAPAAFVAYGHKEFLPDTRQPAVQPAHTAAWNNSNVTVTFTSTDKTIGIESWPVPATVATDLAKRVLAGTVTDKAGITATASATINLDNLRRELRRGVFQATAVRSILTAASLSSVWAFAVYATETGCSAITLSGNSYLKRFDSSLGINCVTVSQTAGPRSALEVPHAP
jgi:hypothetical protein